MTGFFMGKSRCEIDGFVSVKRYKSQGQFECKESARKTHIVTKIKK